jgi:type IV secretion system protein TrbD
MHSQEPIQNFYVDVHRSLTEPILIGGAARTVTIINGTLAGAIGLGLRLWLLGLAFWLVSHVLAVWATKRDPHFVDVVRRHLRYPAHLVAS